MRVGLRTISLDMPCGLSTLKFHLTALHSMVGLHLWAQSASLWLSSFDLKSFDPNRVAHKYEGYLDGLGAS